MSSDEEENKQIVTRHSNDEVSTTVSHGGATFQGKKQTSNSAVQFQSEDGSQQISLNSQLTTLTTGAISVDVVTTKKKRTIITTTTTTTSFPTKRHFPKSYKPSPLKFTTEDESTAYASIEFNKDIYDLQTKIIGNLPPIQTEDDKKQPEIFERAIELSEKLPASEDAFKTDLKKVVDSKDQLSIVPFAPKISESYGRLFPADGANDNKDLLNYYLEIMCFASQFPKTKFCPLDVSIKAFDLASFLDPGTLQTSLLTVSKVLSADFIDKKVQDYLIDYLGQTNNVYVQEIRYMIQNIEDKLIVNDPSNPSLAISRIVELPVLPEDKKPASTNDIHDLIKTCNRYIGKISETLGEETNNDVKEFAPYFEEATKLFKILKKNSSHDKIIEKRADIQKLVAKADEFSELAEKSSKEMKRNATRLQQAAASLEKYTNYFDENQMITTYTINQVLNDAQDPLSTEIESSGDPDVVARAALLDAGITKIRACMIHPGTKNPQCESAANLLSSFLKVVEDKDTAAELQIAQWELGYQNVHKQTVVSRLKLAKQGYSVVSQSLLKQKNVYEKDSKLKKNVNEWNETVDDSVNSINSIIESSEPENPSNADGLIVLRTKLDPIEEQRRELCVEQEAHALSHDLEKSISLISGKYYVHVSKFKAPTNSSTKKGRVSFATSGDLKSENFDDLYPKNIQHPIYECWETKVFSEQLKTTKQVPIDINMLSKITHSKLTSTRSRFKTQSTTGGLTGNFKQYQLQEVKDIKPTTDDVDNSYAKAENSISLIEKEIFRINKKTLFEKYEFVESTAPGLQSPNFKNDDSLTNRYSKIVVKYNQLIQSLTQEPPLLLPRPAVTRALQYITCIIDTLVEYRNIEKVSKDEQGSTIIDKWLEYLRDISRVVEMVQKADDETAIIAAKGFFLNFRSGLASFTMPAEKLDELAGRRSLASLTTTTLRTLLTIIQFTQNVVFDEYCTINSAQSQLEELTQKFQQSKVLKPQQRILYDEVRSKVLQIISASDVNKSLADSAAQKLREVHLSLEGDIKTADDEEMSLFIATIGVRYSIINLHIADGEIDQKLSELAGAVSTDFSHLLEQLKAGEGPAGAAARLSKSWAQHITLCEDDIKGITNVSSIVSQSQTRYAAIADNAEEIYNSLSLLEDKRFPFSVSSYSKLSLHLDKLIDYAKNKQHGGEQALHPKKQGDLSSVLQKHLQSLQTSSSSTPAISAVDEKFYNDFEEGFIQADVQQAQAQIVDNVSQYTDEKDSKEYKVTKLLGKLFAAHIESFTRNYNICSKSTRVCYEILIEFCKSIRECTDEAQKALANGDVKSLKARVAEHIAAIQEIQNQYNDKIVYSEYGRQRIVVFAHFCCISAQMTNMNIFHLKQQDEPFDFDETQVHSRAVNQIIVSLARQFDSQTVFTTLTDIEKKSQSFIDNENTILPIIDVLSEERKYAQALTELVETMMLEADVRLWKVRDVDLAMSTAEIKRPKDESEKATAADLKRSIDIVTENLMHFKTMLQDGETEEDVLMQQIAALDETTKVFCESAITVDADQGFTRLVCQFRQQTVTLVNFLRNELITGTYSLYSLEAQRVLQQVNTSAIGIIRQLSHMEMIDEDENAAISNVLSRLIKQLLLVRDGLKTAASKQERQTVIEYSTYAGCSYEVVANVLLTIKNAGTRVRKALAKEKVKTFRKIVFVTQELIDAGGELEMCIGGYSEYGVESPEFLVKSQFEPIVHALRNVRDAIPGIVPQAGSLVHLVSAVINKMTIVIEPHFEDRPLLDAAVQ